MLIKYTLKRLLLYKKKAINAIYKRDNSENIPTSKKLMNLKILNIEDQFYVQTSSLMWDFDHDSLPVALTQKFTRLDSIHSVRTRGALKGNLYLPKVNSTKYGMKSFKYQGVKILNNLKKNGYLS